MKLYLAFAFWRYYPEGGAGDIVGVFRELKEAQLAGWQAAEKMGYRSICNVLEVDTETLEAKEL